MMAWLSSLVECAICGHQWAAVRPEAAGDVLTCPWCGYHGDVTNLDPEEVEPGEREGWNHRLDGDGTSRFSPEDEP
jgi:hypothetical protein